MIGYIKGKVELIGNGFIILESNLIGYKIIVNEKTISNIDTKKYDIKLLTFMDVKEDSINLFGFLQQEELDIFNKLITVSGVGPKSALSLLNIMSPNQIVSAIISSDIKSISSGQGIGKKIAQRIAMELKDKVDLIDNYYSQEENVSLSKKDNQELKDAIEALISLGFKKSEVLKAIDKINIENLESSEIISLVLKNLSK